MKGKIRQTSSPEFDTTFLGLMGLSSGTYIGFKFPEKPKQRLENRMYFNSLSLFSFRMMRDTRIAYRNTNSDNKR